MSTEAREVTGETQSPERPTANNKRKFIIFAIILVIALAAVLYWLSTRGRVSTDDAQVEGHLVPISPRTSGYVRSVLVDDNELVQAGQLLVQLDRRDLTSRLHMQEADLATQRAEANAAAGQEALVGKTAPAGATQAGAGVSAARAGVAAARKQIASAQDQARSAQAGVEVAQAAVESARTDVQSASAEIEAAQAAVKVAQADVVAAQAQAQKTASDAVRFRELFNRGAASRQQLEAAEATNTSAQEALNAARQRVTGAGAGLEQARSRREAAQAAVRQAQGRLASARAAYAQAQTGVGLARTALATSQAQLREALAAQSGAETVPEQLTVAESQRRAAQAKIAQSAANVRNARLQLSYTQIAAPVTGVVSQKSVQLGQYVQPGQQLMAVVPLKNVWVVANFKETQITHMKVGQRARVTVDTYPGREFYGIVQSIGAATGAKFSLLPPENATGNFVKVVQRIPVKIVFNKPTPKGIVLRPGQNVEATVYVGG